MTNLSAPSSLKSTIPTQATYQQRPPLRPLPTREREKNATQAHPPSHLLQPRALMIRMTMKEGTGRKRKIPIDTSLEASQVRRTAFIFPGPPYLTSMIHLWLGKHSIKKDDFLTNIVQVPPKQHIPIAPFDSRSQTEAFTVSLEGLKGVRLNFLNSHRPKLTRSKIASVEYSCSRSRVYTGTRRPEEAGACRGCGSSPTSLINVSFHLIQKELKKLAKAQGSVVPPSVGTPLPSTPATAPTPTQPPAQPPRTSTPVPISRGVKREFEDNALVPQGPGPGSVGVNNSDGVSPILGQVQRPGSAKAGVPGVRPRPLKKQRVVSHVLLFFVSRPCRVRGRGHQAHSSWSMHDPFRLPWLASSPPFCGYIGNSVLMMLTLFACHHQDVQGQARDMHPLPPIQQPTPQGV